MLLHAQVKARRVASQAQHPRRILDEAPLVQDTQDATLEVLECTLMRVELSGGRSGERHRDRVDGEVAPGKVLIAIARPNLGQRAGGWVALGAPHRQIYPGPLTLDQGGAEPGVEADLCSQPLCQRLGGGEHIPGDHHVELAGCACEQ